MGHGLNGSNGLDGFFCAIVDTYYAKKSVLLPLRFAKIRVPSKKDRASDPQQWAYSIPMHRDTHSKFLKQIEANRRHEVNKLHLQ